MGCLAPPRLPEFFEATAASCATCSVALCCQAGVAHLAARAPHMKLVRCVVRIEPQLAGCRRPRRSCCMCCPSFAFALHLHVAVGKPGWLCLRPHKVAMQQGATLVSAQGMLVHGGRGLQSQDDARCRRARQDGTISPHECACAQQPCQKPAWSNEFRPALQVDAGS